MYRNLDKYIVLKNEDVDELLSSSENETFNHLIQCIVDRKSKKPSRYVVVAEDWPMYETVWQMIENWVDCDKGSMVDAYGIPGRREKLSGILNGNEPATKCTCGFDIRHDADHAAFCERNSKNSEPEVHKFPEFMTDPENSTPDLDLMFILAERVKLSVGTMSRHNLVSALSGFDSWVRSYINELET